MAIHFRNYNHAEDYRYVDDFLIRHYQPGNADGNWIEPIWEYMHFHPAHDSAARETIGIWEEGGRIAAAAHYESQLGKAFFQFHPDYRHLRGEMLDYAQKNLYGISKKTMGLGKAAVLEGIQRCGALGAMVAYVGSDQAFYMAIGFRVIHTSECWVKYR